jgi:hypothetical protein
MPQDGATWLSNSPAMREKLVAVGLIEPEPIPEKQVSLGKPRGEAGQLMIECFQSPGVRRSWAIT